MARRPVKGVGGKPGGGKAGAGGKPATGRAVRGRRAASVVDVLRLPHGEGLELPAYRTADAAGLDLAAAIEAGRKLRLKPGAWAAVPTGLAIALPPGFEGQVRPRSGLALEHGVTVLNAPGTIDADYRGEVKVILINLGRKVFSIERGMRIAQLVVAPVTRARVTEQRALGDTGRGAGGFGSTGVAGAPPPSAVKAGMSARPPVRAAARAPTRATAAAGKAGLGKARPGKSVSSRAGARGAAEAGAGRAPAARGAKVVPVAAPVPAKPAVRKRTSAARSRSGAQRRSNKRR